MQKKESRPRTQRRGRIVLLPKHVTPRKDVESDDDDDDVVNAPCGTSLAPLFRAKANVGFDGSSVTFARVLSLSQSFTGAPGYIEGELWYVTPTMGPGKQTTLEMQWVTCENHQLTISSSWSQQGHIMELLKFDGVRVIFSFSHTHEHMDPHRQVPMTRISWGSEKNMSSFLNSWRGSSNNNNAVGKPPAQPPIRMRKFHSRGGKLMPRYYYFGIEFSERMPESSSGVSHRRQRRLIIFATDIKEDQQKWMGFFSKLGYPKGNSVSGSIISRCGVSVSRNVGPESHAAAGQIAGTQKDEGGGDEIVVGLDEFDLVPSYTPFDFPTTARAEGLSSPFLIDLEGGLDSAASFPSQFQAERLLGYFLTEVVVEEERWRGAFLLEENRERCQICTMKDVLFSASTDSIKSLKSGFLSPVSRGTNDDTADMGNNNNNNVATVTATASISAPTVDSNNSSGNNFPPMLGDSLLSLSEKMSTGTGQCIALIHDKLQSLQNTVSDKEEHITYMEREFNILLQELSALSKEAENLLEQRNSNNNNNNNTRSVGNTTGKYAHKSEEKGKGRAFKQSSRSDREPEEYLHIISGTITELWERLRRSEAAISALEEQNRRQRCELEQLDADRALLKNKMNEADFDESAHVMENKTLRHRLREALAELRDAELAVVDAERSLCRSPADLDRRMRAISSNLQQQQQNESPPGDVLRPLKQRVSDLVRCVSVSHDTADASNDELIMTTIAGAGGEETVEQIERLIAANKKSREKLFSALENAEGQICLSTVCEKEFSGDAWTVVKENRSAELVFALQMDVSEACGVPVSRVRDVEFTTDLSSSSSPSSPSSMAVFSVVHPCSVTSVEVKERVKRFAFDNVWDIYAQGNGKSSVLTPVYTTSEQIPTGNDELMNVVLLGSTEAKDILEHLKELADDYEIAQCRLRCAIAESTAQTVARERRNREQLTELRAERDALVRRVHELDTHLDSANSSLRDVDHECGSLIGLLGIMGAEILSGGGSTQAPERLQQVAAAVQEMEELSERRCCELEQMEARQALELDFARAGFKFFLEELSRMPHMEVVHSTTSAEVESLEGCVGNSSDHMNDFLEKSNYVSNNNNSNALDSSHVEEPKRKFADTTSSSEITVNNAAAASKSMAGSHPSLSALHAVCKAQREERARYEVTWAMLRDIFNSLGIEMPISSSGPLLEERVEVLQEILRLSNSPSEGDNDVNDDSLKTLLGRYEEASEEVGRAVETDTIRFAQVAEDHVLGLRHAYEVLRRVLGDESGSLSADADKKEEEDAVVAMVHKLQLSVMNAQDSLIASVGGNVCSPEERLRDGLTLDKSVKDLQEECQRAAAAFSAIWSMLSSATEEGHGGPLSTDRGDSKLDNNNNNNILAKGRPVSCYDDVLTGVEYCVAEARQERGQNKRLCEELQRVITMSSQGPGVFSACPSPSGGHTSQPDDGGEDDDNNNSSKSTNNKSNAEFAANPKSKQLTPMPEFIDPLNADSRHSSPLRLQNTFDIVGQVQGHIASKVAEVQELRTAMTTSVETLGGAVASPTVESRVIAETLLEVVRETSVSINDIHALLDSDAAAIRRGPVRLRDVVDRIGERMREWETSMRGARELIESLRRMNDPDFALTASPGRSLTPKMKPQPVTMERADESLSLSRSLVDVSSLGAEGCMLLDWSRSARMPRRSVNAFTTSSTATATATSSSSGDVGGVGVSAKDIQDAITDLRSKLIGIRRLTNACGAAVCLMDGGKRGENPPMEMLLVRLLRRAQEVHEVTQMTKNALSLLEDDGAKENAISGVSPEDPPQSLCASVQKLINSLKELQKDNGVLRMQENISNKQKAFLLRDFEQVRSGFTKKEMWLKDNYEKLKDECNELYEEKDCCMREMRNLLALQQKKSDVLKEKYDEISAECNDLSQELAAARASLDDLQRSEAPVREAARMVRRASAFINEQLCNTICKLSGDLPPSLSLPSLPVAAVPSMPVTDVSASVITNEEESQEERSEESSETAQEPNDDEPLSATALLIESGRELERCGEAILHLDRHVQTEMKLRDWVLEVCMRVKCDVADGELSVHALLGDVCHGWAVLLNDKSHTVRDRDHIIESLQRNLETVLRNSEEDRARWKQQMKDFDNAYNEHSVVMRRCLSAMRDQAEHLDSARRELGCEVEEWRARATSAASEVAALQEDNGKMRHELQELQCRLEQSEKKYNNEAVKTKNDCGVMTEACGNQIDCMPAVLQLLAAVNGEATATAAGEEKEGGGLEERLGGAVERARRLTGDVSRCHAMLQEQLNEMPGGGNIVPAAASGRHGEGQQHHQQAEQREGNKMEKKRETEKTQLSLLMERHKATLSRLFAEHVALVSAWQEARDEVSRLQRDLKTKKAKYEQNMEKMELQVGELRALVQKKLEADEEAGKKMEEIQLEMDRQIAEIYKHSMNESALRRHIRQLDHLLRSKRNASKGACLYL